jgi:hypothetical protein
MDKITFHLKPQNSYGVYQTPYFTREAAEEVAVRMLSHDTSCASVFEIVERTDRVVAIASRSVAVQVTYTKEGA